MIGVKLDLSKLKNIGKAIEDSPEAKVGILGDKTQREGVQSNAEIGMYHEYGYGVPKRSFLREPLISNFQSEVDKADLDGKAVFEEASETGSISGLIKTLGIVGEAVVSEAFKTRGDGKWPPHSPDYNSKTGEILVDTGQLVKSISSEVT